MTETILVPLPDGSWLALDRELLDRALLRGAEVMGRPAAPAVPQSADEHLLDAAGLATCLNVPVTWIEQSARDGRIPSVRVGRRVRFRRTDVEAAISSTKGSVPRLRVAK